jgi:hypothetical protein
LFLRSSPFPESKATAKLSLINLRTTSASLIAAC